MKCYNGWIVATTHCQTTFTTHRSLPEGTEIKDWGSDSDRAAKGVD